jgi:hypothetical protein
MNWLKKLVNRGNVYFSVNWRVLPFQPILYLGFFIAAILILFAGIYHPNFGEDPTFFWWVVLSVLCPPLAFLSWLLIKKFPGKLRYMGLWLRLGADVGQFASFSSFLIAIAQNIDAIASEVYASWVFTTIWWFLIVLIMRDSWKLVLTERVAEAIQVNKENRENDESSS